MIKSNQIKSSVIKSSLLNKEKWFASKTIALYILSCISALISYLFFSDGMFNQVGVLVHTLVGILFTCLLIPYLLYHFLRTLGLRRPLLIISGLAISAILLFIVYTGLSLAIYGHQESKQWIYDYHSYFAFASMLLVVGHILSHVKFLPEKRRKESSPIITLNRLPKALWITSASLALYLSVMLFISTQIRIEETGQPIVEDYQYVYGDHPFRPSQTETKSGKFVSEHLVGNSNECANCHQDIAKQWYSSAHRKAASDPTYVTNINLLESKKGIEATRYCEGCHAPIALLSGQLSEGGQHGGVANTMANHEGVSCLSCHRMTEVVHTKGVASFEFSPSREYLFDNSDNALLASINRFLIQASPKQHKEDMLTSVTSDSKMCASCHAQFMDKDMNDWGWVKMQDEYSAWLASHYSGQKEQRFATKNVVRCQDCHMPLEPSDDPSRDANGMIRSHRFLGGNTMLAYLDNDSEHLQKTTEFLQSNKMRISIKKPYRSDATETQLALEENLRASSLQPWYAYKGELLTLNVIVSNVGVGHDFPGGTTDINQAWIHIEVVDAEGAPVYENGQIDTEGYVDETAYFYRSLPVDRFGKLVWKHDLFNKVGEASRNTVKAGESDLTNYNFSVPYWAKSPLSISVSLRYRKLNTRYAKWALKDQYRELPIVDMARDYLAIPVRDKKDAI